MDLRAAVSTLFNHPAREWDATSGRAPGPLWSHATAHEVPRLSTLGGLAGR